MDSDIIYCFKEIFHEIDYFSINLTEKIQSEYFSNNYLDNLLEKLHEIRTFETGIAAAFKYSLNKKDSMLKEYFSKPIKIKTNEDKLYCPKIFIKIEPELSNEYILKIEELVNKNKIDGVIIGEACKREEKTKIFLDDMELKKIEIQALTKIYSKTKGK